MPSLQVKNLETIPHGYDHDTFNASQCARFRYIGQHHYRDIDRNKAAAMYNAIWNFSIDKKSNYVLSNDKVYFELIDTELYDGTYCQMEWYTPVTEKRKEDSGKSLVEEIETTKKCKHCLRRIDLSYVGCPYCRTTEFIY
jgi:AraC family transcriptional regulator